MTSKLIKTLKNNKFMFKVGVWINIIIFSYLYDSLRYIRYLLVKLNILHNTKYAKIRCFKNLHKGERCFIVATGPSLTYDDLSLLKDEYCFGVNSIIRSFEKTDWRPTYYGIQDVNVYGKLEAELSDVDLGNIFIGQGIANRFQTPSRYIPYFIFYCFHKMHGELIPLKSGFSNDASEIVYDGYSVTYSMLQLAVYMGFSEIYLLGTDCTYEKHERQHFVESGWVDKQAATVGERMIYAFTVAKEYADNHEIQIFNATRGGMLDVFERVELNDVVDAQEAD